MKYSVALKIIGVNNLFNDEYKLVYTCQDKNGQNYEFITEAKIPIYNYIAMEFNDYTIIRGVIRPVRGSVYPLNVKNNKLYLYDSPYKSGKQPKIN